MSEPENGRVGLIVSRLDRLEDKIDKFVDLVMVVKDTTEDTQRDVKSINENGCDNLAVRDKAAVVLKDNKFRNRAIAATIVVALVAAVPSYIALALTDKLMALEHILIKKVVEKVHEDHSEE